VALIRVPQGDPHDPDPEAPRPVWKPATRPAGRTAFLKCGGCGESFAISDHDINAAGFVSPSVVCPIGGCGWHVHIVLEDWRP